MVESDNQIQFRTIEMTAGTSLPEELWMPYSCLVTSRFIGLPTSPNDAYALTIPALRNITDVAAIETRESTSTLLLEPFSNVENYGSVTRSVIWTMWPDIQQLPALGRIRRVLSSLPYATDIDLICSHVSADEFVRTTRGDITGRLWNHYVGLPFPEKILHNTALRSVLQHSKLATFKDGHTRFRTKYFIEALDSMQSGKFDIHGRQVLMAIEQGSWDSEGQKPFMDVSFWTIDKTIGKSGMQKLLSIGIAPEFRGPALASDTRRGPWVLSWDNNARGNLIPIELAPIQIRTHLGVANHQADIYLGRNFRYPERRTQDNGVFAQNRSIPRDEVLYRQRLKQDMFLHLPKASRDVLITPMHCDESIRERSAIEQFEQIKRAARKNSMYGSALEFSEAGRTCLKEHGIAVDTETITLFHECLTPKQLQEALGELPEKDRSHWFDVYLTDDLVCLHNPFNLIRTYGKLGLFRFYRNLSQISVEEWSRIGFELEKTLGDEGTFGKNQYASQHASEFGLVTKDGNPSSFDIMLHSRIQQELYKNPYAGFIDAIRNAKVSSESVQNIVREDRPYLEAVEQLLEIDLP